MAYIRYKTLNNKLYAYEIQSYWDPVLKQARSKSKYLGAVDPETKQIKRFIKKPKGNEKLMLNFGDGYFLKQFIQSLDLYPILQNTLIQEVPELIPLLAYRLCTQSAMRNCQDWLSGNILRIFFSNINLSSQRISEILAKLGQEDLQRKFFVEYARLIGGSKKNIIIDATCMPSEINHAFNSWGKSSTEIQQQFKLLCVVDQVTKSPLYYRFLPGNITDITTLQTTIAELKALGINNSSVLLDSGYFSESNIIDLYHNKIDFLTRIPNGRTIFRNNVKEHISTLESLQYAQVFGSRTIFIKKVSISLYGRRAYLYLILDPHKKAKDGQEIMHEYCNLARKSAKDKQQYETKLGFCGIIGLASSKSINSKDVLSCYYLRQSVEQVFGFLKDDLSLLPLMAHNDETIKGYLFLQLLLLIIFIRIRERLPKNYTVEKLLLVISALKCKVFDDQVIPAEATKEQKMIFTNYNVIVPKRLGI